MSFALFFPEGSSIMGRSSNIGGSSNVSTALLAPYNNRGQVK
jgi:hypothetical protein